MSEENILVTRSSMPPYEEYIDAIKPLWDSHWLTNMGKYHKQFEAAVKEYLGVDEVSLMVNGHMALEMTIQAFGFPKDSEVITTPFTFVSTTHAIVRNGLVPVFCDVKDSNGTIDESKIESLITERTVAIIPVHVYGNVCNVDEIQRIADKYGLKVIYDAAHAFGVKYKGKGIGNYGDASIFSFHATKVFNSIEGGAVTFSDHRIYERLYDLKNFGIHGEELVTDVGANAKMNEFCAAMGLCNLRHIDEAINTRKYKWNIYMKLLKEMQGIRAFTEDSAIEKNYAYLPIIVTDKYKRTRNELYNYLRENNVFSRKYFYPLTSDVECYKGKYINGKSELNVARELSSKVLVLPFFEDITEEQINRIIMLMK